MIEWSWQENPYQSNAFKLAEIPRSELRRNWINDIAYNADLEPQMVDKLLEPDQRFEEELFAHLDHKPDLTPLYEHAQHFEKLPITPDDLNPVNLQIMDPSGLISFSSESIRSSSKIILFLLPPNEDEGDTDAGIFLDY